VAVIQSVQNARPVPLEPGMPSRLRSLRLATILALAAGAALSPAFAQPDVPAAVSRLLEGRSLSEDDRKDIRIRHGVWGDADLDTPARKARAALLIGDWNNPALKDEQADGLDRAEAAILRGEPAKAIEILDTARDAAGAQPMRAARLRGQALVWLGKLAEADTVWQTAIAFAEQLGDTAQGGNADELVERVRCMMGRSRLPVEITNANVAASDYKLMLSLLGKARTEIDRLCWRASLAEAQLLVDKDNPSEGETAAREAIRLNPRSAEAFFALGSLAVDTFAFDQAEKLAEAMREVFADSPHAAIIVARARVRQSDPLGATEVLGPVLALYPNAPDILAAEAAVAAASFDYAKTDALLAAFDARFPGSAEAYALVGRTLSDARQYADSSKYLSEAAKRAPAWAEPWIELGLMELQFGRNNESLAALEKATALDPFNIRAENSLKLVRELITYGTVESAHFIIRHKPGIDEILAKEMVEPLEANHRRVTGKEKGGIDHQVGQKTVIELYPDHEWFAVRIAGMPRIHTIAAATGPVVAMEAPRSGPNHLVGPYDWERVVRHEYVHTVTLSRTKNRIPHWFTEAAAVYLEDAPRDWNAIQVIAKAYVTETLFDFEEINLAFIRPKKASDRSQAYAQGHWMYEFMIEKFGPRAPLELMDAYASGTKEAAAFQQVLKVSREEFFDQFKPWARQQLLAWGMLPPDAMPKAEEILAEVANGKALEDATLEDWQQALTKYPEHPDLLMGVIRSTLAKSRGTPTADLVPTLEAYAKARPVDPLPHKLLTTWFLSGGGKDDPSATERVIAHLEFLDAREQYTPAYASELANRYGVLGQWDKAWAKALRAVRIAPYDARTRETAATVAVLRKDYEAAQWQLDALKALEPDRDIHSQRLDALRKMRGN
jgi:tetratricopeptide (TPR) repeat protein